MEGRQIVATITLQRPYPATPYPTMKPNLPA